MTKMPTSRRRRWLWLLVLALLAVGGWNYWRSTEAGRPVVASVRFADGARVQILATVVGKELNEGFVQPQNVPPSAFQGWLARWFPSKNVDVSTGSIGWDSIHLHHQYVEGESRMRGMKLVSTENSLILLLRGFDRDGAVTHWGRFHMEGGVGTMQKMGGQAAESPDEGDENEQSPQPSPSMSVEIWTGEAGQWQPIDGPFQMHVSDPRAFCRASIFPRSVPDLRLRFTRKGQPPVELALKNPAPARPQPWKAEPLPATKRAEGLDIKFSCGDWERNKFGVWLLPVTVTPNPATKHIQLDLRSLQDATGNSARKSGKSSQGMDGARGYWMLMVPGLGPLRAVCELRRTAGHPTPLEEVDVFADGEYLSADQPLKFTPSPYAQSFGNVIVTFKRRAQGEDGETPSFEIDFTVTGAEGTLRTLFDKYQESPEWKIYIDGKVVSGVSRSGGRQYSGNGADSSMTFDGVWNGSIPLGAKFQLALPKPREPETIEFTFEPPPLPSVTPQPQE